MMPFQFRVIAAGLVWMLSMPAVAAAEGAAQEPEEGSSQPAEPRVLRPGARGTRAGRALAPPNAEMMTVQQVEQYFDQVVLRQARSNLQLNDGQFLRFGAGLRRLQMARRQQQRQRMAMLRDLNALANATPVDEPAVSAKLRQLEDLNAESVRELGQAYEAIDRALDLRQRARFRVFEETMERRKLDLLARARQQAARSAGP